MLEVAIDEFAMKGFSSTSINVIARKAQISIGAMYSYFDSKENLFLTIVDNAYCLMESILNEVEVESSDIFDCIKRMLVVSRRFAIEYPQLNQIYLDITTQALSYLSLRLSHKLEIVTPDVLCNKLKQAKLDGMVNYDLDEKVVSFCLDNIFMMYQFSFSSDYYKERMKIYIGEERLEDMEQMEENIIKFIRGAIENHDN